MHGHVVLVRAKERAGLGAELLEAFAGAAEARQHHGRFAAHLVFEVGVDGRALAPVDELHQGPQSAPHGLEHRQGGVLPPFVGLHVQDERHLFPHHRDRALLFQQRGNGSHLTAKALETGLVAEHRQLHAEQEQIESLGFLRLWIEFRRQTRHLRRQLLTVGRAQQRPRSWLGELLHHPTSGPHYKVLHVHRGHFGVEARAHVVTDLGLCLRVAGRVRALPRHE